MNTGIFVISSTDLFPAGRERHWSAHGPVCSWPRPRPHHHPIKTQQEADCPYMEKVLLLPVRVAVLPVPAVHRVSPCSMQRYTHTCMYARTLARTQAHTHKHARTHSRTQAYTCISVHTLACDIHPCIHSLIYAFLPAHIHSFITTYLHTIMHAFP